MQIGNKNGVIYCRVSSAEQVKNGHGLQSQEQRCREFAKYRGLEVIEVFNEEGVSGGLIDRPAITRMLALLRLNKNDPIVVIIDDISRLARDLRAHIDLRVAIQEAGGILQSPSIEFGEDSDSRLVENMLASVSQHQRQKNAEQVKNRMRARMMCGYWIMKSPRGYKMQKVAGHGNVMVRQEPLACTYRLHEREHGGLKPATQRYLMKVAEEAAAGKPGITPPLVMKPGTRLIREWHGVTYEVIVIPGGVLLNGEQLKSLTEAAHKITGAKWSGPRFFGLVKGGRASDKVA